MQGAQIVQAIHQLDDHDAEAATGAHENLAVGEVLEGGAIQVVAGQFGAAIHQFRHHFAEMRFNIGQGDFLERLPQYRAVGPPSAGPHH